MASNRAILLRYAGVIVITGSAAALTSLLRHWHVPGIFPSYFACPNTRVSLKRSPQTAKVDGDYPPGIRHYRPKLILLPVSKWCLNLPQADVTRPLLRRRRQKQELAKSPRCSTQTKVIQVRKQPAAPIREPSTWRPCYIPIARQPSLGRLGQIHHFRQSGPAPARPQLPREVVGRPHHRKRLV